MAHRRRRRKRRGSNILVWVLLAVLFLLAGAFGWYVFTHIGSMTDDPVRDQAIVSPASDADAPDSTPAPEATPDPAAYLSTELYITEVMPKNRGTLPDSDGEFSDWIELGNLGDTPIALGGWYLSDKEEFIRDWAMPDVELAPGEYIVVFASGKNTVGEEIHTSFSLSEGETVYLTTPAGDILRTVTLDQVPSGQSLSMGSDGQFYATAASTPGYANTPEGYGLFMDNDTRDSGLLIWEVVVYSGDWVELKNTTSSQIDLSGYYITDSLDKPEKHQPLTGVLGPGELTVVPCEAFGLNSNTDDLYLCRTDGTVCDWAFLHGISSPGSFGRMTGKNGYFYFTQSTPGAENTGGYRTLGNPPTADVAAGVYPDAGSLTITLTGENIRYTTDGSYPTLESPAYTGPITITETAVIRAISCPEGLPPSEAATLSYFLGDNGSLPIVSLVTDQSNLFGPQGIYSNHERAWEQGWEREANLSFFEEDGSFSIDCGIKIHGRTSRRVSEKRSFTLKFRGKYDGDLNYDVFGDGQVTEFSSLLLRAAVEDTYPAYFRDVLFADMAIDFTGVPAQNYRYVSLYINGEYWGVYAIREHHSEEYFASHYGVSADTVQMANGEFTHTSVDALNGLFTYVQNNNLSTAEAWQYMQEHVDIPVLIDWLILECWSGDFDVYENVRFYSSPEYENGKVVYGMVDMDLTMLQHDSFSVGFDAYAQIHSTIPRALLQNAEFKDMFLTRLGQLLQGELSDRAVMDRIDALAAIVEPEAGRDMARWGYDASYFTAQIATIKNFAEGRAQEMINSAVGYFGLSADQRARYFGS